MTSPLTRLTLRTSGFWPNFPTARRTQGHRQELPPRPRIRHTYVRRSLRFSGQVSRLIRGGTQTALTLVAWLCESLIFFFLATFTLRASWRASQAPFACWARSLACWQICPQTVALMRFVESGGSRFRRTLLAMPWVRRSTARL